MDTIQLISETILAGVALLRVPDAPQPVADAYQQVKALLAHKYAEIDLARLEAKPDSQARRAALVEDLTDAGAGDDLALLTAIDHLLNAITHDQPLQQSQVAQAAAQPVGVDLARLKAASLKIQEVQSSGTGVRLTDSQIAQDVAIAGVAAGTPNGEPAAAAAPSTQLTNVNTGRDLTIVYGNSPDVAGARRRYLAEVVAECELLPWRLVNPNFADPDRSANLSLAEIYTELSTTELRQLEREEELRQFMALREVTRLSAQQMADEAQHLLVMGDPGSGKSTFVKHLAYTLAKANLADTPATAAALLQKIDPWQHGALLPVRIELRQVAAFAANKNVQQGNRRLLLDYLQHLLTTYDASAFWAPLRGLIEAAAPHLLLLLDGLDEAATSQRQLLVDMVNDWCDRYPAHRVLVTCRPYAYVGQPWRLRAFRTVTLAPFDEAQIDRFVANWYDRLAQRERIDVTKRKARLQAALRQPNLRGLAERPLLLTVMAQLHTFTGDLPDDRARLYAETVNLLLQRWEARQGEEHTLLEQLAIPNLKMSDVEAALHEVAFRAHQAQPDAGAGDTADIDEADLRQWLAPHLQEDWNKAGRFIAYIRERAGLLIRRKTAAYTFPHRTFQEYLAACHLINAPDYPSQAAQLVRENLDRWREVFLLSVARAAQGQAVDALNNLCPEPVYEGASATEWRMAVLAATALVERGHAQVARTPAGQAIVNRLRHWLAGAIRQSEHLPAAERANAGRLLGRLGDTRPAVLQVEAMEFCYIPAGPFLMGSGDDDRLAKADEKPQHEVDIPYGYWLARYPVTNAHFAQFVAAGGYQNPAYWGEAAAAGYWADGQVRRYVPTWNQTTETWEFPSEVSATPHDSGEPFHLPNHPRIAITWYEALAFTRWLTALYQQQGWLPEGYAVTLPSEAEWEKGARGGRLLPHQPIQTNAARLNALASITLCENLNPTRRYPWGDALDANRLNYQATGIKATNAVGCFPASAAPYGLEEVAGNAFEWTRSLWGTKAEPAEFGYPYRADDGREALEAGANVARSLRGCSYAGDERWARSSARLKYYPNYRDFYFGFRCVVVPLSR